MRRRPQDTKEIRRLQGIKEIRERREKADAEPRRKLDHYKDRHLAIQREQQARAAALETKRNRFANLSIAEALAAARRLNFVDLEANPEGDGAPLNRPSLALLELFLSVLHDRGSVAVLQ